MNKRYLILILFCVVVSLPTYAKLSCNDLDDIATTLDEFADDFSQLRSRDIDRRVDNALEEMVDALNEVAYVEDDRRLTNWINDLEIAWEDREREDFEESMEDIIYRLDEIYDRDCNRR